jgi:DNA recombination protein RmuC
VGQIDAAIVSGIVAALAALSIGFALGRYIWSAKPKLDPVELATLQAEAAVLNQERNKLSTDCEKLSAEIRTANTRASDAREENARLAERIAGLSRQVSDQTILVRAVEQQRNNAELHAGELSSDVARLKERESHLTAKVAEQATQLVDVQKRLTAEFENIANRILKSASVELSHNSEKTLAAVLDPLRQRIQEFQQKVEMTFDAEIRDVLSLKEQIKLMVETSHTIGNQADGLAKALRGDSQLLGKWGELALERILEAAGLKEGREYISQGRGLGLKDDDGKVQRPDILVRLPENRTLIIDSKVPLSSYERLIASKDSQERSQRLEDVLKDFKGHIDDLSGKRYQDNDTLQAHDCVLVFVPIEGALATALAGEPELFTYGWDRRVVLVGPPTLLMTMRTVASIWRYESQSKNAQDIAKLAGDLCDKITLSVTDFHDVTEKIGGALEARNEAVKRLTSGKGNALWIGQRIRELGVKTKRPLPNMVAGVSVVTKDIGDIDTAPTLATPNQEKAAVT